ncbi:MAG: endolytic transglycosylase MltG [Candidatus Bruticola sp.]
MKKILVFLLVCCLAAAAAAFWLYDKFNELNQPVQTKAVASIYKVESGTTLRGLGRDLEKKNIIRSALVFEYWGRKFDSGSRIQAGHYFISAAMQPKEILQLITEGKTASQKITFPEGLTLKECARIVEKHKIGTADEFLRITQTQGKKYGDIFPNNMEGYFLPDTYTLPLDCDTEFLVRTVAERFKELALPCHTDKSPLSLKDTIILASLVEREAQVAAERPVIAGVYVNRLNSGMKLECDATVQFALGRQKEYLLYRDLEIDSPYNTYKYVGLPVGPICSPGLDSIKAACSPKPSRYYYYVRNDVKGDGSHVFGQDFGEHQNNIRKYQL